MTLADALKRYRRKHKLVQKELAARIGISVKHYAQLERGKAYPSQFILQRICEVTTIVVAFKVGRDRVSDATTKYLIGLGTKKK